MDRQAILELIRELLADILEIEPSTISESSSFAEDLDADSCLIELVEGLQEELRALGGLPHRGRGPGGAAHAVHAADDVHAKLGGPDEPDDVG